MTQKRGRIDGGNFAVAFGLHPLLIYSILCMNPAVALDGDHRLFAVLFVQLHLQHHHRHSKEGTIDTEGATLGAIESEGFSNWKLRSFNCFTLYQYHIQITSNYIKKV